MTAFRMGFLPRRRKTPGFDVLAAGRRIRAHLDTEAVLRATVEEILRLVPGVRVGIWLTTGRTVPSLAVTSEPPENGDLRAPPPVLACARKRRSIRANNVFAVPIVAPRSGLLGVLQCSCRHEPSADPDAIEALAVETGFALETANLYEQALAERDKSEAILERVGDAVVVTDPVGTIRDWNRGAERATGAARDGALGRGCAEMLGLRRGEQILDCAGGCPLLAARSDESSLGLEVWRVRDDGRRQPLLADVSAVLDAAGHVAEVVHSLRDVTRLKEADEAKTMFLATASHELKTPLTVIQGFGQTLLEFPDLLGDDRDKALRAMVFRSKQLNKIVDRLLLSSRIEVGRTEVTLREVELVPLLTERVEALAATSGRDIGLEVEPDLPAVWADADATFTIMDHLLDNALKYSPDGGRVLVSARSDGEDAVVVSVADPGIGMDDEQVARCFEKFWQAETSDGRRFGGTGIGLFIVRSLAEAMRGRVSVESAPGKGSTFHLRLPRRPATPPVEAAEPAAKPGVGERSITREFMRQIGIPVRRQP